MLSINPIIFKTFTIVIFIVFAFFISDVRNKNTKSLIRQPWISIMRISYPVSPLCFVYFLFKINKVSIIDIFAFLAMVFGTIIVIFAKSKLGKNHSWTGYSATNITNFTTTGIYNYIRHPLYLGIIIAVFGTALVVFPRYDVNLTIFIIYIIGMIFTFTFIFISSKKETEFLTEKFGKEFIDYVERVPSFFPKIFSSKAKTDKN